MKRLIHVLSVVLVIAGLSWVLWRGLTHKRAETEVAAEAVPAAPEAEPEHEDFVVTLEKEKSEAAGIETAQPEKSELVPRRVAFGRVLDPLPLVALDGDLATAEAAVTASRAEYERTQKLLAAGENTSRKSFEAAEALFRADEIKADSLRRQAALQWGSAFPLEDSGKRREFVESLVRGEAAIARADLLPGDAVTEPPNGARVVVLGREQEPLQITRISPAADADARTQAQGYILLVEKPPFPLRPGMALTAWLELPGKPRPGLLIPRSAVLRHDGRTWIFVEDGEEKFARKPVTLDSPLDNGWFVDGEGGGVAEGDHIVVTGAQVLLSEEMKAAAGSAAEE